MPDDHIRMSRADKHAKRRKNKQFLLIFIGLAALFLIVLFSLILSNGKEKVTSDKQTEPAQENVNNKDDNQHESSGDKAESEDEEKQDEEEEEPEDSEEVEEVLQQIESTRENVIEAYSGNWQPIGTRQEGEHGSVNFEDGSADREEIKQAVLDVTKIDEANLSEHWIGYGGEQKVIATVADVQSGDNYHVYLSWIDKEGWQVTLVERIKELEKRSENY